MQIVDARAASRGAIFTMIGGMAFAVGRDYPVGSATNMGPGYFPDLVSLLMIGFGLANLVTGLGRGHGTAERPVFAAIPLLFVTLGVIAFGVLVERLGLIAAIVALIVVACLAGGRRPLAELAAVVMVLCVVASALFVYGLGMPASYLVGH